MSENNGQTSGLANIFINVIIPVFALKFLSTRIGPLYALLIALAFPLVKGVLDYRKSHKANYFSVLGVLNVSITGSLALLGLGGMWFALKEAIFPSLVGVFVIISSYGKNPFIKTILVNPQVMHLDLIHQKLESSGQWEHFKAVLKKSTKLLAGTFFVSGICNFFLAIRIFTPLDAALDDTAKANEINHQIGTMTMWASIVIIVPSMIMLSGILWYLLKGIRTATGLTTEQILKS